VSLCVYLQQNKKRRECVYENVKVYFHQYKKRVKGKGKKKCHTETMRGRKSRYNLYIRAPLMCRLGRTSRSKNKGRS
jgi:hypothetical protein